MARTKQTARKSEAPKEEEEGNGQPTYADYLAERGYTPLCCDNSAEDLFTIFCCFMWLYGFLIAFFCLLMKAYISTTDTSAALWLLGRVCRICLSACMCSSRGSPLGQARAA